MKKFLAIGIAAAFVALAMISGCTKTNTITNVIDTIPPLAPALSSPSNGGTSVSLTPTLAWSSVTGATSYNLQVAIDSAFMSIVIDKGTLTSTSTNIVSPLASGVKYYWRVNASNGGGISSWSTVWSFTTKAWCALGTGMNRYSDVNALVVDGSGNLYAGGNFITAGNVTANGIAEWK